MKLFLPAAALLAVSMMNLPAQDIAITAWQGVTQQQKFLKDSIVLGAQLTEGGGKQSWEFQLLDTNYKSDRRIVQWSNGRLESDRAGRMKAFEHGNLIPLGTANLTASVAHIRQKTRQLLADAGKNPDSIQYALSRREGQAQPQWSVVCFKEDASQLAVMSFSADNSQLLEVDLDPGHPKLKSAEKEAKSFGVKVEKTFKGIGADLEEFFTGKRTVDK